MSKRSFSIKEQIARMSVRGKVTIVLMLVALVAFAFTCTYISLAKEEPEEESTFANSEENVELNTSYIEFVNEIVDNSVNNTVNEIANNTVANNTVSENKVQKEVTYKGKKVKVAKAEVAPANSAEDSQKQKTGGEQVSAAQAVEKFENDGQSAGIDVSAHQGRIDWGQVRASGIEFAMIRCGFRGQTAGAIYEDAYFKTNISNAVKNGVKVGIYFYSTAVNETEALEEAAWVVETIKRYSITYPVAYDFEDFGRYRCAGVSGSQATSNAITFLSYVSSKGYQPMMYANKNDISSRFERGRLSGYKFWLAHYTSATNYTGSYQMWQYTSSGSVPGISGRVDMNVAYFRYGAVAKPKHTCDFTNGTIINTPESKAPTCTEKGVQYRRCKDCSESQAEELPALGHTYGDYVVTTKPTVSAVGVETRTCKTCGATETKEIPKLPPDTNTNTNANANANTNTNNNTNTNTQTTPTHTHDYTNGTVQSDTATCTADGIKTIKCATCDQTTTEASPAKGHNWGADVTEIEPSVDAVRKKTKTCQTCRLTESEEIPQLTQQEGEQEDGQQSGQEGGQQEGHQDEQQSGQQTDTQTEVGA